MALNVCPKCGHPAGTAGTPCIDCDPNLPSGRLSPELSEWEQQNFDKQQFLASLREVEETGGVELKDFIHELEQGVSPRE